MISAHLCSARAQMAHSETGMPAWLPKGARLYLSHIAQGQTLRALGRDHGCHASTVLRQIRLFENRRDDPLVDNALRKLDHALREAPAKMPQRESRTMPLCSNSPSLPPESECLTQEALAGLRHLLRPGAVLIVAPDMPKAAITCDQADGVPECLAALDRGLAEVMALNGWISLRKQGRVCSYVISAAGRLALRGQPDQEARNAMAQIFAPDEDVPARRPRYGLQESPVAVLARRRDKDGKPFLDAAQVQAAERLREDYVMAQLENVALIAAQELLAALETRSVPGSNLGRPGTKAARARVLDVLRDLGPGLGDMALRCCCRLEGVEAAEQAMGYAARSGKIVLRIALERMVRQYHKMGEEQMMIG
jgi:hypothetical protein